jgi:hypothetical protein
LELQHGSLPAHHLPFNLVFYFIFGHVGLISGLHARWQSTLPLEPDPSAFAFSLVFEEPQVFGWATPPALFCVGFFSR